MPLEPPPPRVCSVSVTRPVYTFLCASCRVCVAVVFCCVSHTTSSRMLTGRFLYFSPTTTPPPPPPPEARWMHERYSGTTAREPAAAAAATTATTRLFTLTSHSSCHRRHCRDGARLCFGVVRVVDNTRLGRVHHAQEAIPRTQEHLRHRKAYHVHCGTDIKALSWLLIQQDDASGSLLQDPGPRLCAR